ncbi:MAG: hypothetical protein IJB73_00950 [Firmicutes bacterium]|nr:hypothetical protein [Bacillota bacterium]
MSNQELLAAMEEVITRSVNNAIDKKLDERFDKFENKIDFKLDILERRMDQKLESLENRMDAKLESLEKRMSDNLDCKIEQFRTDTERMFTAQSAVMESMIDNSEKRMKAYMDGRFDKIDRRLDGLEVRTIVLEKGAGIVAEDSAEYIKNNKK